MKKLSLIMALVIVATIGGVYATWNYYEGSVDGHLHITPIMAEVETNFASGTLSASPDSTMQIVFDDVSSNYTATLVGSGDLIVIFTANPNSTEYNDEKVYFNWNLATTITLPGASTNSNWFDDGNGGKAIFTKIDAFAESQLLELTAVSGQPGVFKGTISWATISAQIAANTFVLEDYDEFRLFQQQLTHVGNIGFDFVQTTAPVTP